MTKLPALLIGIVMVLSATFAALDMNGNAQAAEVPMIAFAGGSGTVVDPYIVVNIWELQNMTLDLGAHYALGDDIDASITNSWDAGAGFTPIGTLLTPFGGSLDGRNYTISGLFIDRPAEDDVGLFGYVKGAGAFVQNLGFSEINITGNGNVGGLAGNIQSAERISNCSVSGRVHADGNYAGGILGYLTTALIRVEDCAVDANITATSGAGGLAGFILGYVRRCTVTANVSADMWAGGFAAVVAAVGQGVISDCHVNGMVRTSDQIAGGFIAQYGDSSDTDLNIMNCSFTGAVDGGNWTGGFVGYISCDGMIDGCSADSNVVGETYVGGFCGIMDTQVNPTKISNCTVKSNVNGISYVGGVIGQANGDLISITAYVSVNSTGNGASVGGLCGEHGNGTISDCIVTGHVQSQQTGGFTGGLVGSSWGNTEDSMFRGTVIGKSNTGGLIGRNFAGSAVCDCEVEATVHGEGRTGGLVGDFAGATISECHADATITGPGTYVGGLIGYLNPSAVLISESTSDGTVDSTYFGAYVGGFVGMAGADIRNCSSAASVSGENSTGGGFAGILGSGINIESCAASGSIQTGVNGGGFIGHLTSNSNITNCYAWGNVSSVSRVGGFVGWCAVGIITNCYSAGAVSGNSSIGGFLGYITGGTYNSCFWDVETSGMNTSAAGTGKTTDEMMDIFTFLPAGWDFVNVWDIRQTYTYPYFGWESENFAPIASDDSYQASEDSILTVQASGVLTNDVDYDHDTLTVLACDAVSANGADITWNPDGGFTYDPRGQTAIESLAAGEWVLDTFNYTVSDGNGGNDNATVTINVTGANDIPQMTLDEAAVGEDSLLTVVSPGVLANDNENDAGDTLHAVAETFVTTKGASVVMNADGSFSYDPRGSETLQALAVGEWAVDMFQYTLTDSFGGADTGEVQVNVTGLNDAPVIAMGNLYEATEGSPFTLSCTAEEIDTTDTLVWSLSTNTTGLSIVPGTGVLSGTMTAGVYYALVTVSDGNGGVDSTNITLTVLPDQDMDGTQDSLDEDDDGDGWSDYIETLAGTNSTDNSSVPDDIDLDGIADIVDPDFLTVIEYNNQTIWNNATLWSNQTVPEYHNSTVWNNATVPEYNNNTVWANETVTVTETETPVWAWGALIAAIALGILAAIGFMRGGKPKSLEAATEPIHKESAPIEPTEATAPEFIERT